jgi:5'-AMP-activated protein kinase catalytic alpha subunit
MAASPLITPSSSDSRQFGGRSGFPQRSNPGISQYDDGLGGNSSSAAAAALAQKRRRWYLGIQSKKEPAHVMSEVYKALHVLHFEWKVVAPYRVKCRWQPKGFPTGNRGVDGANIEQIHAQSRIKIGLQLYKVQNHRDTRWEHSNDEIC